MSVQGGPRMRILGISNDKELTEDRKLTIGEKEDDRRSTHRLVEETYIL